MGAISTRGETEGSYCCRKSEEIAHLRIVITRLKERKDNLQQVPECEKFKDKSWLRLWSEVAEDIGSGDGAASVGSVEGTAIEIGGNEVWETVFVGDEMIKYCYGFQNPIRRMHPNI